MSFFTASGSPVIADWFTIASPSQTMPSNGMMLPICTTTRSPISTSSEGTSFSASSFLTHTFSVLRDMLRARSPTDFLCVQSSSSSPTPNRNMIDPAVLKLPRRIETVIAVASSTGTSILRAARHFIPIQTYLIALQRVIAFRSGIGKKILLKSLLRIRPASFSWNSALSCLPEFCKTSIGTLTLS